MLWLAVHLPRLPLEAMPWGDELSALLPGRCVVQDGQVLAADAKARAAGVMPGMSAATATALAPQVLHRPRDTAREAAVVRDLALALLVLTPNAVIEPDGVLLEVHASLRLFGGVRRLTRKARRIARRCGVVPRLALAPTARAAHVLARCARGPRRALQPHTSARLLGALPLPPVLEALGESTRLMELLHTIGARRVADVRTLPRAGLQRRGGGSLLRALDQAFGNASDPRDWFEPPAEFGAELELMHRADDAQRLGHAAERLVQALAGWLARQWLAASRLRLVLRHEWARRPVPDTELVLEFGQPSRDAKHLMAVLQERLQRLVLAAPVYGLKLLLDTAQPCAGHAGSLLIDDPQHRAQDFRALIDRLVARLGAERVRRLALLADHRPERAYAVAVPGAQPTPVLRPGTTHPVRPEPPHCVHAGLIHSARPEPTHPVRPEPTHPVRPEPVEGPQSQRRVRCHPAPARPIWLLPVPLPLQEQAGRPMHSTQPLTLLTRAERIEAGWFDGALVCRDYHVAEGSDHRLRWIYRERRGAQAVGWYLHGLFG